MSNRDLIESLYAAFGRGDVPGVFATMQPDVVWNEAPGTPYADGNPYVGPQAIGEGVFGRIMADYDGFQATPAQLVVDGDTVVSLGAYTGTRKGTGVALDAPFAHHWTIRDGKISAFQQYTDTAQFRDQVG
ncbi:nuclear transport factor 2 family protein [Rubrivirga sp. IMCC45206]|uniref:nuclear transport factor 2 family protein n=1 Tax=Rubrivirga sp. IMCC45206 TaxID=3391614 RepID=UPI0039900A6A